MGTVTGRARTRGPAALALGVGLTLLLPDHRLFAYGQFLAYLAAVAGLTVLIGASGQVSFGHAGLMATGGYATALTQNWLYAAGFTVAPPVHSGRFAAAAEPVAALWTLPVALLAGVAAALVVGALLGSAAARLHGPYLAGLTLAFGLVVAPVASLVGPLHGEQGFTVHVPRLAAAPAAETRAKLWVLLAGAALVVAVLAALLRGRPGMRLRAVRDDEVVAAAAGIPVARTRVVAFVASAGAAGLGGGLYVYLTGTVLPGYFGLTLSLYLVLAVVVGGAGSLAGAAWGTLFVIAVPLATSAAISALDLSPAVAARVAGNAPLALLGLVLVVVTVAAPAGLRGVVARLMAPGPREQRGAYENGPSTPRQGRSSAS